MLSMTYIAVKEQLWQAQCFDRIADVDIESRYLRASIPSHCNALGLKLLFGDRDGDNAVLSSNEKKCFIYLHETPAQNIIVLT